MPKKKKSPIRLQKRIAMGKPYPKGKKATKKSSTKKGY